jgi:hypothetical protein
MRPCLKKTKTIEQTGAGVMAEVVECIAEKRRRRRRCRRKKKKTKVKKEGNEEEGEEKEEGEAENCAAVPCWCSLCVSQRDTRKHNASHL